MVVLGTLIDHPLPRQSAQVVCQSSLLAPYSNRAFLLKYLEEQTGSTLLSRQHYGLAAPAVVEEFYWQRHAVFLGPTGVGKTRAVHLLVRQLLTLGYSIVMVDPKLSSLYSLLAEVRQAGLCPEQVTVMAPSLPGGTPAWNILAQDLPATERANLLVDLAERAAGSFGIRRHNLAVDAAILTACGNLSIVEMVQALTNPVYRAALIRHQPAPPDPVAWGEAVRFFELEFAQAAKSEVAAATDAATRLLRELLRSQFFRGMLAPHPATPSLRLKDFWRQQRVLAAHLDATVLGQQGAALLAGLLCNSLLATAMQAKGGKVALVLDELWLISQFAGEGLSQIIRIGRSQGLHLVLASLDTVSLPEGLRAALKNCSVEVAFRCSPEDSRAIAASVVAGQELPLKQVVIDLFHQNPDSGEPDVALWQQPIFDANGRPLRLSRASWSQLQATGGTAAIPLRYLLGWAYSQRTRLYVIEPGSEEPMPLSSYLIGLPPEKWWISGPVLNVTIAFPKPKVVKTVRRTDAEVVGSVARTLQELLPRTALLKVGGVARGIVQIADAEVPPFCADCQRFLSACLRANGQTKQQIAEAIAWRAAEMERLASGSICPVEEECSDGSRW